MDAFQILNGFGEEMTHDLIDNNAYESNKSLDISVF